MDKQFGKGKQDYVFHSIVNSNDLQLVCGPVVAVPNSFPNPPGRYNLEFLESTCLFPI